MEHPLQPFIKDGIEYHAGWVYSHKTFDAILGNQMSIIEAIGLPNKQEEAIKSQIRQALFRPQRFATFLTGEEIAGHNFKDENTENLTTEDA